jgi:hypothetical protein
MIVIQLVPCTMHNYWRTCHVTLMWERCLREWTCCRCLVPGCDDPTDPIYVTPFLAEAIPPADGEETQPYKPHQCEMYIPHSNATNLSCPLGYFSRNTVMCDAWVYEENEHTIVGEVCSSQTVSQPNFARAAKPIRNAVVFRDVTQRRLVNPWRWDR